MKQTVLPAISNHKNLESFLEINKQYCVVMNFTLDGLEPVLKLLKKANRSVFVHIDLIKGLESNEYGVAYLNNRFDIYGIISTHSNVIQAAKKKGIVAVQRIFLIDSHSLNKSIAVVVRNQPDYIEMLPGYAYQIVGQIKEKIDIPLIGGGLIDTKELYNACIEAGLSHITTSNRTLWQLTDV